MSHACIEWKRLDVSSHFYRAMRMHSADYAVARCPSVRPSVRPSYAGILSKFVTRILKFFYHRVAHHSSFSVPNWMAILRRGALKRGRRMQGV